VSVSGGSLLVNGARFTAEPASGYGPGHSLEFVATFSTTRAQDIGFGSGEDDPPSDVFDVAPWAMLSAGLGESALMDRTWTGGAFLNHLVSSPLLGVPHDFRIHWTTTAIDYYVDDQLVDSQPVSIAGPMRPAIRDAGGAGSPLPVSWIRMTPYASSGSFHSRVFDAGVRMAWSAVRWSASVPDVGSLAIDVRAGDTPVPDGTWTPFVTLTTSGNAANVTGRYVQYQARLSSSDPEQTPVLNNVGIACDGVVAIAGTTDWTLPSVTMARPPMPNPTSHETSFEYAVGTDLAGHAPVPVALTLFDLQGRAIRSLVRAPQSAGRYRAAWNVADDSGRRMRAGVYYYRLTIGRFSRNGKVVVLN
jgi:hypothetical protein